MNPKSNINLLFLSFAGVSILVLGALVYFLMLQTNKPIQNQQTTNPPAKTEPVKEAQFDLKTAKFAVYKNEKFNFSISYPQTGVVEESSDVKNELIAKLGKEVVVSVQKTNSSLSTLADEAQTKIKSESPKTLPVKTDTKVFNTVATRFDFELDKVATQSSVIVKKGNLAYSIRASQDVMNMIVDSFYFLDSVKKLSYAMPAGWEKSDATDYSIGFDKNKLNAFPQDGSTWAMFKTPKEADGRRYYIISIIPKPNLLTISVVVPSAIKRANSFERRYSLDGMDCVAGFNLEFVQDAGNYIACDLGNEKIMRLDYYGELQTTSETAMQMMLEKILQSFKYKPNN